MVAFSTRIVLRNRANTIVCHTLTFIVGLDGNFFAGTKDQSHSTHNMTASWVFEFPSHRFEIHPPRPRFVATNTAFKSHVVVAVACFFSERKIC